MAKIEPKIEASWSAILQRELKADYFTHLLHFLHSERKHGKIIYPPQENIFYSMELTPFDKVKVVIIGQDPYHGAGQAQGLAFSVAPGVKVPPSLRNILKELADDCEVAIPTHGNLVAWAREGVFLSNAVFTVEDGKPGSHQNIGWQWFSNAIISALSQHRQHLVFMLWGAYAISKRALIDEHKHLVLSAAHPSPLSAYRGFFGCKHFSQANKYLQAHQIKPINWQL